MKKTGIRISLLAAIVVLLYGCPKDPYYMYTNISPDGSCYREFIRNADSVFAASLDTAHNPFPMKLDSTWKVTFYKRYKEDTSRFRDFQAEKKYSKDSVDYAWFATAVRHYNSVEDMAREFSYNNSSWESITPTIKLKKKFRWFYTYFEYQESYPSSNPFTRIPVSEYLSEMEVSALYGEDKEIYKGKNGFEIKEMLQGLEDKADSWLEHNIYEEIFQLYLQHYNRFDNPPVDSASFASQKDSIYYKYVLKDTFDFDDLGEALNHHFNTEVYSSDSVDDFDKFLEERFPDFMKYSDIELDYKMTLPGKVIETNAPFLHNDTLTWRLEDDRFFHNDYHLKAISRKANYWAFLVTVIAVALALAGFLVKRKPI